MRACGPHSWLSSKQQPHEHATVLVRDGMFEPDSESANLVEGIASLVLPLDHVNEQMEGHGESVVRVQAHDRRVASRVVDENVEVRARHTHHAAEIL